MRLGSDCFEATGAPDREALLAHVLRTVPHANVHRRDGQIQAENWGRIVLRMTPKESGDRFDIEALNGPELLAALRSHYHVVLSSEVAAPPHRTVWERLKGLVRITAPPGRWRI